MDDSLLTNLFSILLLLRNTVIGTVSFGLFIGAILFSRYLIRLSGLPKSSREYRELSYHMEGETLLRYCITITCLILINILFFTLFELGKTCTFLGVVVWSGYGVYTVIKDKLKK